MSLLPRTARRSALVAAALALTLPATAGAAQTVTSLADSGAGSLRAALADAASGETIDFAVEGTIRLDSGLQIDKDVRIDGPGARALALSGRNEVRVLHVMGDGTEARIDDLTIRAGRVDGDETLGAGLLQTGANSLVRLERVALVDNEAMLDETVPLGGGAAIVRGKLELVDSTVAGNRAIGGGGGGVFVGELATFEILGSTIAGNAATGGGGILQLDADGSIRRSTIAGNTADAVGAGIGGSPGGAVTVGDSLIADACDGPVASEGGNVFATACVVAPAATDLVGSAPVSALADHGGPTDTVLPLLGNPALDHLAGPCAPADQRGVARPQGAGCDAGAVEARTARLSSSGPLSLGTALMGERTAPATVTLTNAGEVGAVLGAITASGPAAAEVERVAGTCAEGAVVAPGATCTLSARLAPTSAGAKEAVLSVALGAPAPRLDVPVSGAGEAPPVTVQPQPQPQPQPIVASATARVVGITTRAATLHVRVRCATVAAPRCAGAVKLRIGKRKLTRSFSVKAGGQATLKVRLKQRATRISVVTVITRQPDGTRTTTHHGPLKVRRR